MSDDERSCNEALARLKDLTEKEGLTILAHGKEGIIATDGQVAFKYFWEGVGTFQMGQLEFIKQHLLRADLKHYARLEAVMEPKSGEIVFVMELLEGQQYNGGHLSELRALLTESIEHGITHSNVHPKNVMVVNDVVKLCDIGRSIMPLTPRDFREMAKRTYLTYRYHFSPKLDKLMRLSLEDDALPHLFGFQDFLNTLPRITGNAERVVADDVEDAVPMRCRKATTSPSILNPFDILVRETESSVKALPSGATYGDSFEYQRLDKAASKWESHIHQPFRVTERAICRASSFIVRLKESVQTDYDGLAPASDWLDLELAPRQRSRRTNVTLLIKASPLEWRTIEFQIRHIVRQLDTPHIFSEIVVVTDEHQGPFLRPYGEPNVPELMRSLNRLKLEGWIDRIAVAPDRQALVQEAYSRWFGLDSICTHSENGQHLFTTLYGFESCRSDYVLQMDSDCVIIRRTPDRDYLSEMVEVFENDPKAMSVTFKVCGAEEEDFHCKWPPWRTEARISLLDVSRIQRALPLPNTVSDGGRLVLPWHRALDEWIRGAEWNTYRGRSRETFFVHVPNSIKRDTNVFYNIVKQAEGGCFPNEQEGKVDLQGTFRDWYELRNERFIFVIRGRNVDLPKLRRAIRSVDVQSMSSWGMMLLDAGSDNGMEEYIENVVMPRHHGKASFWRNWEPLTPIENMKIAISSLCSNPESVIITLDADDALIGDDALRTLDSVYLAGADLTVGSMLRTDKEKEYPVDFTSPRSSNGGNVWQHLRSFKKELFDAIPDDYLKIDGEWVQHTEDWAFMLPMVEIAHRPIHIEELLYFYEPSTSKSRRPLDDRERIIAMMLSKPPLKGRCRS